MRIEMQLICSAAAGAPSACSGVAGDKACRAHASGTKPMRQAAQPRRAAWPSEGDAGGVGVAGVGTAEPAKPRGSGFLGMWRGAGASGHLLWTFVCLG
jgi:hypothetical protein